MWFLSSNTSSLTYETIQMIEKDIAIFVQSEVLLFKKQAPTAPLSDSIIGNLAMFDLSAITTEVGYGQMKRLLSEEFTQLLSRRMRHLVHMLYIRYGRKIISELQDRTIGTMSLSYGLDTDLLNPIAEELDLLWVIPFVQQAYATTMMLS